MKKSLAKNFNILCMILAEAKRIHVFGFFAEGKQIHVFWFLAEEKQTIVDKVGQALPDDI